MNPSVDRRVFLGLVAAGVGSALVGCSSGDSTTTTTTVAEDQPTIAEIITDEDIRTWFDDPDSVAVLGAGRIGERLLGECGIATPASAAGLADITAAIETERACGSLVQIAGWFMTPTEAALAQAVAALTDRP
jgi:hypothetical protein